MSEEPKVIWVDYTEYTETYEAVTHTDCGGTKYHRDDTVTALQAKVARLEAVLKAIKEEADKDMKGSKLNHLARRIGLIGMIARKALDTTTATCDNTREGE